MFASKGVDENVHETGKCHQGTRHGKVIKAGEGFPLGCHAPSSKWERQHQVDKRVDEHVYDDAVETLQGCGIIAPHGFGVCHFPTEKEKHDGVESDGAEFSNENPDVVTPEAGGFVFSTHPALDDG